MNCRPPISLWPDRSALGPVTDLYQLTMMAGYRAMGKENQPAVFEMFVRKMPPNRSYLIFTGLEQAIGDLLYLAFSDQQVEALRSWPVFASVDPSFFDWLRALRFEGDVWAMPEGTVFFPGEPIIRVEAALAQAQWVETFLLASIGYPTLVASKAARVVQAAAGRPVYDFGARRAPGPHAGLLAARAAYLAGCAGTSHVEAARLLDIPCVGTMAHSWVESFATEPEAFATEPEAFAAELKAFAAFAQVFPQSTMLVDTYDTERGVMHAAAIEPAIHAVRLDSGDLIELARKARATLDSRGRHEVRIFATGDLDEARIAELVAAGAPIDGLGVGTEMATSRDAPALAIVYKLVALDGAGRIKLSTGKKTYPLAKQVHRMRDAAGKFVSDNVSASDEPAAGEPLLIQVVRAGRLAGPLPALGAIRDCCGQQRDALPRELLDLHTVGSYPVCYSARLEAEERRLASLL
jgi:nicotinate phosphoribosyltransferase